ncbi:MAG: hypothetical protein IT168_28585 [Bryobacterales bacterium]|nr:hypothetical protein [Bryobacterales bacterium]
MVRLALVALTAVALDAAVTIERTAWNGWPNCYRIANGEVELIVTSDIGPRVMRYGFVNGQNLFKEFPEQLGKSGEKDYQLRGGHRLWVAPEELATTWALDNSPVKVESSAGVLTVTQPPDSAGIEKQIVIRLADSGSKAELIHRVKNTTPWSIELSPWTLTMMAPGGAGIAGFPPRGKHPEVLLPTNPLVMWAYTDFSDVRWKFTKKYLTLKQDRNNGSPQKVGLFNPNTWAAYLLGADLFIKRTTADPAKTYPDFNSSLEMFANAEFLELETLGPLGRVASGKTVEHVEFWELRKNINVPVWNDDNLDAIFASR